MQSLTHPFEEAFGLLPRHELGNSFGHLPKLVKVEMSVVWDRVGASLIDVVNVLDQHAVSTKDRRLKLVIDIGKTFLSRW